MIHLSSSLAGCTDNGICHFSTKVVLLCGPPRCITEELKISAKSHFNFSNNDLFKPVFFNLIQNVTPEIVIFSPFFQVFMNDNKSV